MSTTDLVDKVLEQMRSQMTYLGLNGKELAERMDVTPGYVSHIFNGRRRNLTLTTLGKLAEALEMRAVVSLEPRGAMTGVLTPPEGFVYTFDPATATELESYPPPPPPAEVEHTPPPERPSQQMPEINVQLPQQPSGNPAQLVDDLLAQLRQGRYGR